MTREWKMKGYHTSNGNENGWKKTQNKAKIEMDTVNQGQYK